MTHAWDKAVKALAAFLGAAAGAVGGVDTPLKVLVAFMVIDYVTGMAVGWLGRSPKTETGHLDSKAGFAGLMKKGLMLIMVLMAALLDLALGGENDVFRSLMVWFYIAGEGLSILENLTLAGVPFPKRIRDALEQLQEE